MFRRPTVRYGRTPQPETPYQKAAQVWDERIGSARVQAKNWRLMAFGSLILSAGLALSLVWQSLRGTVTPWVVQVDHLGFLINETMVRQPWAHVNVLFSRNIGLSVVVILFYTLTSLSNSSLVPNFLSV